MYKGMDRVALGDVNISIGRGVKTVLLGANGAGKSTLFYHFNGVYRPSEGTVIYDGKPLKYSRRSLRNLRSQVAVVLQNPDDQIFCSTVEEDVAFGPRNLGLSEDEVKERVEDALFKTGMAELRSKGTLKLSYGQRKRLTLAGAIAMRPKLLILDEPTAGLDPQMAYECMELADQMHMSGTTVVISTHDVDLAYEWADEIHVMRMGKLIYSGDSEGFYCDPKLVHTVGLTPPSVYSVCSNYCSMTGDNRGSYPKTLPELVSRMSKDLVPGKMFMVPSGEDLTDDDLKHISEVSGGAHVGLYGTSSRRKVLDGGLFSDFVFNGLDSCLMENLKGYDSVLICDEDMMDAVKERIKRLESFGCKVGYEML